MTEQERLALAEQVAETVRRNLASGRVGRVLLARLGLTEAGQSEPVTAPLVTQLLTNFLADGQTTHPLQARLARLLEEYVDHVGYHYRAEQHRVAPLEAREGAAWTQLYEQLAGRAYHLLLGFQLEPGRALDEAADFAQAACQKIYASPFTYDVAFDAWATVILRNEVLQYYTRSADPVRPDRLAISLDEARPGDTPTPYSLYEVFAATEQAAFTRVELQDWLLRAIEALGSPAQQQVIIETFFDGRSDEEIAARLGKTANAVRLLRLRALRRLYEILGE